MDAFAQQCMMRNLDRRCLPLGNNIQLHPDSQQIRLLKTAHLRCVSKLKPKFISEVNSFHSGNILSKKSSKTIHEDQLELVNIFSPIGLLLAEGTPIIYLQRMCKTFDSYSYKECTYQTTTKAFQNLRNLQFIKEEFVNDFSTKGVRKRKGQNREMLNSMQDLRTIRKIQADIVNDGESQLTFKSKATEGNISRKVMELEQFAKNHLQDLCTFHVVERRPAIAVYKLKRKAEDEQFYKAIFDIIFKHEKDEVNMMVDYYNTVRSFSGDIK